MPSLISRIVSKKFLKRLWDIKFIRVSIIGLAGLSILYTFTNMYLAFGHNPDLCLMCHIMKKAHTAYSKSSHAGVPCQSCHYTPGFKSVIKMQLDTMKESIQYYVTHDYGKKPIVVEIHDASCLRSGCHKKEGLIEKPVFFGEVIFFHKPHLRGFRRGTDLKCADCHSMDMEGEHIAVKKEVCALCHFNLNASDGEPNDCVTCHRTPVAEITYLEVMKFKHEDFLKQGFDCKQCHDMKLAKSPADKEKCVICHGNDESKVRWYEHTELMHEKHISMDKVVGCFECHSEIKHKIDRPLELDCGMCHKNQKNMYEGRDIYGSQVHVGLMAQEEIGCSDCHTPELKYRPNEEVCTNCHDGDTMRTVADVKGAIGEKVKSLTDSIVVVDEAIGSADSNVEGTILAKSSSDKAKAAIEIIENDRSMGTHNLGYANALLDEAMGQIRTARQHLGLGNEIQIGEGGNDEEK